VEAVLGFEGRYKNATGFKIRCNYRLKGRCKNITGFEKYYKNSALGLKMCCKNFIGLNIRSL